MDGNSEDKKVWGIHTQNDSLFLNKDLIAIGWRDFGDLSKVEAAMLLRHTISKYTRTPRKVRLRTEPVCYTGFSTRCRLATM